MTMIDVGGRSVRITNVDRVLFPAVGFTKAELLDYYARVAPALLPHIADRPMTLARWPEGVAGQGFFQTTCPHPPPWMETLPAGRREYCLINDAAGLLWAVNLASIEFHPLLSVAADIDTPTQVVFDLDPGPPAGLVECCRVAVILRDVLDGIGLASFPKSSGAVGFHVYIPLNVPHHYAQTKTFARSVAAVLAARYPDLVVDRTDKRVRPGKVLIDWGQNDRNKSTACVYSVRAGSWPAVSTPLTWDEVAAASDDDDVRFTPSQALARVEAHGDLFAPTLSLRQHLPLAPSSDEL